MPVEKDHCLATWCCKMDLVTVKIMHGIYQMLYLSNVKAYVGNTFVTLCTFHKYYSYIMLRFGL